MALHFSGMAIIISHHDVMCWCRELEMVRGNPPTRVLYPSALTRVSTYPGN